MSKVSITRSLLDDLAVSISLKSGEPVPMTLAEMKDAVDDIQTGGTLITKSITQNGIYDAEDDNADGYSSVNVSVSAPAPTLQSKTYTVDSAGTETITADSGYDGLSSVAVSVPSATITSLTSPTDLSAGYDFDTASGTFWYWAEMDAVFHPVTQSGYASTASTFGVAGVTEEGVFQLPTQSATTITPTTSSQTAVTAGKYTTGAVTVAAMPTGTAGTPTATKGTVSNHSVSVTPSVTNTTGYITGGTKTGTAVSVSASELVSGTYTVDSSGTKDVTNYASASIPAGTAGTPSATKGSVSNHSVTVTPSVTNSTGWITGSTKTGTGVSVSASELVSGSETKTANGTYNVTNLAELVVAIPIQHYYTGSSTPSSSLGADGDIYLKT